MRSRHPSGPATFPYSRLVAGCRSAAAAAAATYTLSLAAATVAVFGAGPAAATTWRVPAQAATIQAGLDSAAVGDTVLVAAGTYSGDGNRGLDFRGKSVVLRSERGAEATTIDCGHGDRGIHFHMEEGPAAVVDGFTIVHGRGLGDDGPGGIWVQWAQPTIRNCVIAGNEGDQGGGVRVYGGTGASFENCAITENKALAGGGVLVESGSPTFTNCDITRNRLGVDALGGGGICCLGGEETTAPVFTGCLIADNQAGSASSSGCNGGGLLVSLASPVLVQCTLSGNYATGVGGGVASIALGASVPFGESILLERTILWGNSAAGGGDDGWMSSPGDTLSLACSAVDSSRIEPGVGEVVYLGDNLFADPLLCRPSCTIPADSGTVYTLAENSPCLPEASPCGQLIGAREAGCGPVVVWTGQGDGFSWGDPDNWSTGMVPQPGEHVQIMQGTGLHIFLTEEATIDELTMCGRGIVGGDAVLDDDVPDTLEIAGGGGGGVLTLSKGRGTEIIVLTAGDKLAAREPGGDRPRQGGGGFQVTTGAFRNLTGGEFCVEEGTVGGSGTFLNDPGATFLKRGPGAGELGLHLVNAHDPSSPGVQVLEGDLLVTGLLDNGGNLGVSANGILAVAGQMQNLGDGSVAMAGTVAGTGTIDNYGQFTKVGSTVSSVTPRVRNLRDDGEEWVGELEAREGTLAVATVLENRADVSVNAGATLQVQGQVENRTDGFFDLAGQCTGSGGIHNGGLFQKSSPNTSELGCSFTNFTDPGTGAHGRLEVNAGTINAADIDNGGTFFVGGDGRVNVSSHLANEVNATLAGTGIIDFSAASFDNQGIVSPGSSPGTLHLIGDFTLTETGKIEIEIGWAGRTWDYDVLDISGMASFDGALHVTYPDGYTPTVGDSFQIIRFPSGRVAEEGEDSMPPFDCLSGLQLPGGVYMRLDEELDSFWLVAVDSTTDNHPPVAEPDEGAAYWGLPVTLHLLANDWDQDGNPLKIAELVVQGTRGTVYLDAGDTTVTYVPPTYYVPADSFTYYVTDCSGGADAARVAVGITYTTSVPAEQRIPEKSALLPNVPNPFNPVTAIEYELSEAGPTELAVFDVTGRRVKVLAAGYQAAGRYTRSWDGRSEDGRQVAPGVYFVRLAAGEFVGTRKMVLAK